MRVGSRLLNNYFLKASLLLPMTYLSQKDKSYHCETKQFYQFLSKNELFAYNIIDAQYVEHILAHLRDKDTDIKEFRYYSDRLIRVLVEHAIAILDKEPNTRASPMGKYQTNELKYKDKDYCIVSILRSGNAFLPEIFKLLPGASVGQILIQRDEKTSEALLFYAKFPDDIGKKQIILVDPMLATGGSAVAAIEVLKSYGVNEKDILFINLISCRTGIDNIFKKFPLVRIITASVDPVLVPEINFLAPGIGDFGDRYFGTVKN